jgi:hypothetical protein
MGGSTPTALCYKLEKPEFMTVTVIPLEANQNPYPLVVEVMPDSDKNLKQVFSNEKYWNRIFRSHSPVLPPMYR